MHKQSKMTVLAYAYDMCNYTGILAISVINKTFSPMPESMQQARPVALFLLLFSMPRYPLLIPFLVPTAAAPPASTL
jgi:hypothetical protein